MSVDKTKLKQIVQEQKEIKNKELEHVIAVLSRSHAECQRLEELKAQVELDIADLNAQELEVDQLP
jgi:uncharacterized tellurite resistance protein B-like protein